MLDKKFSIKLVTPMKIELEVSNAKFIKVRTTRGDVGIYPNHANFMSSLGEGLMKIILDNEELTYFVDGGFLEFNHNHLTILAEDIILASNEEEVRKIRKEALEKAINLKKKEDQDIMGTKKRLHDSLLK